VGNNHIAQAGQWRSQPKNLGRAKIFVGAKMFDFRRITLFFLEKRLSKHKIAIFSKHLGGHGPFAPPGYAYEAGYNCIECQLSCWGPLDCRGPANMALTAACILSTTDHNVGGRSTTTQSQWQFDYIFTSRMFWDLTFSRRQLTLLQSFGSE